MRGLVIDIIKKNHLESPTVGIFTLRSSILFDILMKLGEGGGWKRERIVYTRIEKKNFFYFGAQVQIALRV